MKRVRSATVSAANLIVDGLSAAVAQEPDAAKTLIRNARLLAAGSDTLVDGMSILVEGDRITRVASSVPVPEGATTIDARDRVMAPGVIDQQGNPYPVTLGAIEEGASASFFLVDGNPLDDQSLLAKPGPHLVVAGYSHKWTSKLSTVASYAYGWLQTSESRAPLALKEGGIVHANLVWRPVEQFATGVEYMWGTSRATDEALGSARRVQLMARFDF